MTPGGPLKLSLKARGAQELADVVVFKDGRPLQSIQRGTRIANGFTPLRLVVRLTPPPAGNEAPFSITVRAPEAHFELLPERRGDHAHCFGWFSAVGEAAFTLSEGFAAQAPSVDFPIHLQAAAETPLTIRGPSGETTTTVQKLLERPMTGTRSSGGSWTLLLEAGDAVVDPARGLGTREFAGEWDDPVGPAPKPGGSWYYARIVQVDGEIAWSSPVFVNHP